LPAFRRLKRPAAPGFGGIVVGSRARMSVLTDVKSRVTGLARAEKERYSGGQERPLGGYLAAMGVYAAVTGTLALATRLSHREIPDDLGMKDLLLSAVATHKLSRLITKDPVTSPLRAPFTVYQGQEGPAELEEEVRGEGARKAVGELITCPFCIDLWVATGLMAGFIYLPRTTRLAIDTLAVLTGADLLQFGYARLQEQEQS
jgi:Protein of unknown function (DUF1360)